MANSSEGNEDDPLVEESEAKLLRWIQGIRIPQCETVEELRVFANGSAFPTLAAAAFAQGPQEDISLEEEEDDHDDWRNHSERTRRYLMRLRRHGLDLADQEVGQFFQGDPHVIAKVLRFLRSKLPLAFYTRSSPSTTAEGSSSRERTPEATPVHRERSSASDQNSLTFSPSWNSPVYDNVQADDTEREQSSPWISTVSPSTVGALLEPEEEEEGNISEQAFKNVSLVHDTHRMLEESQANLRDGNNDAEEENRGVEGRSSPQRGQTARSGNAPASPKERSPPITGQRADNRRGKETKSTVEPDYSRQGGPSPSSSSSPERRKQRRGKSILRNSSSKETERRFSGDLSKKFPGKQVRISHPEASAHLSERKEPKTKAQETQTYGMRWVTEEFYDDVLNRTRHGDEVGKKHDADQHRRKRVPLLTSHREEVPGHPSEEFPGGMITPEQIDDVEEWLAENYLDIKPDEKNASLLDNPLRNGCDTQQVDNGVNACNCWRSSLQEKPLHNFFERPLSVNEARHNVVVGQKALMQAVPIIPKRLGYAVENVLAGEYTATYGLLWYIMSGLGGELPGPPDRRFQQPQFHTRYRLPYTPTEVNALESSIVHWLYSINVIPLPPGPDLFGNIIPFLSNGVLLCRIVEAIEQAPMRGVYWQPRNETMASSNVTKAINRLNEHGDISKRHLQKREAILRGDRHYLLGLLEDIQRWANGVPPRPNDPKPHEQPYLPPNSYQKQYGIRGGQGKGNAHMVAGAFRNQFESTETEYELEDSFAEEDRVDRIGAWLNNLRPKSWQSHQSQYGSLVDAICSAASGSALLLDLLATLEEREPNGVQRDPKSFASRLRNIDKALNAFRLQPRLAVRHLYKPRDIAKGKREAILGLLDDIRTCPVYRRRYRTIQFYRRIAIERCLCL